jgi:hypothetical protein
MLLLVSASISSDIVSCFIELFLLVVLIYLLLLLGIIYLRCIIKHLLLLIISTIERKGLPLKHRLSLSDALVNSCNLRQPSTAFSRFIGKLELFILLLLS